LEILKSGLVRSPAQIKEIALNYDHIIMPDEDEDVDLTHWWVLMDDGTEMLYIGSHETFATYVKEKNGGIQ
jgi:hypothetical protein